MDALVAELRRAGGGILWVLHVNADADCLGSAFALRETFGGTLGAPDGLNKAAKRLASALEAEVDPFPHPENHAACVVVDTGSRSGLGRLAPRLPAPLLVDHHAYGDLHAAARLRAWDPARASCAEVALALLDAAGAEPSPRAALALLAGIVADTARFRYADAASLRAAARLVERAGVRIEEVEGLLADEDEEGDGRELRHATLKAATRAEVTEVGRWLVATSRVGSFDAAAATALVRAGADLAVVGRERSQEARLSLRASPRLRPLHLGELANAAAREIGWSGGGHEGAAGMRGDPPLARAEDAILRGLLARLEAR